ncbi:hypothetical protein Zmor_021830 [Zophobas morio]|uniref:Uncharacterized protein n=1 Tax=Zophobas morio TaxID=2755281 RepID=A0AA38MBR5_9CUCU|nr:hypothetical protein Zmor_021830 [Zophobas morio]
MYRIIPIRQEWISLDSILYLTESTARSRQRSLFKLSYVLIDFYRVRGCRFRGCSGVCHLDFRLHIQVFLYLNAAVTGDESPPLIAVHRYQKTQRPSSRSETSTVSLLYFISQSK